MLRQSITSRRSLAASFNSIQFKPLQSFPVILSSCIYFNCISSLSSSPRAIISILIAKIFCHDIKQMDKENMLAERGRRPAVADSLSRVTGDQVSEWGKASVVEILSRLKQKKYKSKISVRTFVAANWGEFYRLSGSLKRLKNDSFASSSSLHSL